MAKTKPQLRHILVKMLKRSCGLVLASLVKMLKRNHGLVLASLVRCGGVVAWF